MIFTLIIFSLHQEIMFDLVLQKSGNYFAMQIKTYLYKKKVRGI